MLIKVGSTFLGDLAGTAMACRSNTRLTRHSESKLVHSESEISSSLSLSLSLFQSHEDVEKMGVANYNAECRKIVMRYSSEWEDIVTRMGRWIDFKNDYKTLYPWFMESIW